MKIKFISIQRYFFQLFTQPEPELVHIDEWNQTVEVNILT